MAAAMLLAAACSAPVKLVLPGKVDLPLAQGDRIKLCTDDGVDDTTPESDCVIVERSSHPIAPYADALKARGWARAAESTEERQVWTLAKEGGACTRVLIDGEREKMSRKRFAILRFEVSEGACA